MNRRDALKATLGLAAVPLAGTTEAKSEPLVQADKLFIPPGHRIEVQSWHSNPVYSDSGILLYTMITGKWMIVKIECPE